MSETNDQSLPAAGGLPPCETPQSALRFAITAHGDQKYGDAPYGLHLRQVASVLAEYGCHAPALVSAAWLHDVLEDTPATYRDLRRAGIDPLVCQLVSAVTNEPGKNRRERNIATYRKIAGWTDATILKLADRIANVRYSSEGGTRHLEMYRKEYADFRRALYRDIPETRLMWRELDAAMAQGTRPRPAAGKA